MRRHQHVAVGGSRRDGRQHQAGNRLRGQILETVYRDVDFAGQQGSLQFLGKHAVAAGDLPNRSDLLPIAAGADRHQRNLVSCFAQSPGHPFRLPTCQGTCARSDSN